MQGLPASAHVLESGSMTQCRHVQICTSTLGAASQIPPMVLVEPETTPSAARALCSSSTTSLM